MKTQILLAAGLFYTAFGFAQIAEQDFEDLWSDNIQAIANLKKEKIIEQTNFPLEGDWSMMLDLPEGGTEQEYTDNLENIFSETLRAALKNSKPEDLKSDGGNLVYTYSETYSEDDMEFEFMTFYTFQKIEGKWMLVSIFSAG